MIPSGEITNLPYLKRMAATGRPLIMSTGMSSLGEVETALHEIEQGGNDDVVILHCLSNYPADPAEANLRAMETMATSFGRWVGYSDHTIGSKACELAVAAGAVAIEKHFTYRIENQTFHDHAVSADPAMMQQIVAAIRAAETYLGRYQRSRGEAESKNLENMRRSVAAAADIPCGVPVKAEWLTWVRPAWGLGPDQMPLVVGKTLARALKAGEIIRRDDIV